MMLHRKIHYCVDFVGNWKKWHYKMKWHLAKSKHLYGAKKKKWCLLEMQPICLPGGYAGTKIMEVYLEIKSHKLSLKKIPHLEQAVHHWPKKRTQRVDQSLFCGWNTHLTLVRCTWIKNGVEVKFNTACFKGFLSATFNCAFVILFLSVCSF